MFVVKVTNMGATFWLGGTVWRFSEDRASRHDSAEQAGEALAKARKFMTADVYRRAVIEEVK